MRSTLIDNKKFVEAYVAQSYIGYFGRGHVKKKPDGWFEMYIPGYSPFYYATYDSMACKIINLELGKKHPLWKSREELYIWYDMNCVE
jgi:hypothetical protein